VGDILNYIDVSGEGKPILFLHGLGQNYQTAWKPQLELANEYRLIIPDLQSQSNNITIENMALGIIKLLARLRLKSVIVCGISLGGIVALEIQKQRPDLIESLIISNSTFYIPSWIGNYRINELSKLYHEDKNELIAYLAANSLHNQSYKEEAMDTFNITDTYLEYSKAPVGKNYFTTCLKINKRILLIGGLFDKVTTVYGTYSLKMLIPHAEIEMFNCGHLSNIEKSCEFNQKIREFLK
jgi:pimeloyl-ACP methyl ester carboxylesterase